MSREKQIEEMASEMMTVIMRNRNMLGVAETLYEAGYRKQGEAFSRPHENAGEWISVEERLPEESCECLMVSRVGVVYLGQYSYRHKAFNASDDDDGDRWKFGDITHWMPLPEPPKKGGAE